MRTRLAPFAGCTLNSFLIWNDACFGCTRFETSPPTMRMETPIATPATRKRRKIGLLRTLGKFIHFSSLQGLHQRSHQSEEGLAQRPTGVWGIYRQVKPRLRRMSMRVQ